MFAKRSLIQIVVLLGMLLVSACTTQAPTTTLSGNPDSAAHAVDVSKPTSTSTPEPLPALDPAVQEGMEKCANIVPGQVCLVEGPVTVEAQPERSLSDFEMPGEILSLADIHTIELGEAGSTKGHLVMRIQSEWPGGAFTAEAFGDVKLTNEVVYGTREFNPMQSLTLTTGPNEEGKAPTSGFFVASPEDGNLATLVVNGAELSFGSGAVLTGQQGGLSIRTMFGSVGAWFQDKILDVKPGNLLDLTKTEIEQNVSDGDPAPDPAYENFMRGTDELLAAAGVWEGSQAVRDEAFMRAVDELMNDPEFWAGDQESRGEAFQRATDELLVEAGVWESQAVRDEAFRRAIDKFNQELGLVSDDQDSRYDAFERAIDKFMEELGIWPKNSEQRRRALEELRRKQKAWKGGWWKLTLGPITTTGACKIVAGGYGGGSEPYTAEIPICRGNNGNTILMYDSGLSYDRIGPNLFTQSSVTEFDLLGNGKKTTEGHFMTLQVVSPTRMILSNTGAKSDGCSTANVIYLDFVRDDPNVRCGEIIYVEPWATPEATTPTPEPQQVDPPVEGQYQARVGMLSQACDPAAKAYTPSFTSAGLSLSPDNKLVVDTGAAKYELELANLTYPFDVGGRENFHNRFGIFTLQQPVDSTFGLTMSLMQMPDQQWSGSWLVMNEDSSKLCGGSIDLLAPK